MRRVRGFVLAAACLAAAAGLVRGSPDGEETHGEHRLSALVLQVLEHFKQPRPVGVPGARVPDPHPVPDMKHSISFGTTLYFKNTLVHGLSKFRILHMKAEIAEMEVTATLLIDKLQARGNYTMSTWVNRAQGPFTVDVTGLRVTAKANLGVERDGKLRAQDIAMDISFSTMATNFENLDFLGSMLQGVVNSVGTILFDSIKPYVLKEAYAKARTEINNKLDEVAGDMQFPNSVSPLDMVIADARKKVQEMDVDPYKVKDYNTTVSIFSVTLTNTWITGISSFHRVGNITLQMENNTVIVDFEIGTQKLSGAAQWDVSAIRGLITRAGTVSFTVEYVSARVAVAQPLDTRERPELRRLDADLGNVQVRCNGAGTLDYAVEALVNVVPNLLRYQIVDALEGPIKEKIQLELIKINVEEAIKQELPRLDEIQKDGFKLSALRSESVKKAKYDDDEFFNF